LDRILRDVNGQQKKYQKLTDKFKVTLEENGKYIITAK
jgi:hypothetical protein